MIDFHFDPKTTVLTLHPESALQKSDFAALAKAVDPQIEEHGDLAGLILDVPHFPGWDSFGALVTHLRFVRDHHKHVKKIAVVTDSHLGDVAEHLTSHFVAAEIRHFPAGEMDEAKAWISGG
ncbi:MAG: STAS/SEC14 domain-containing protein [Mycobacterium sp.]